MSAPVYNGITAEQASRGFTPLFQYLTGLALAVGQGQTAQATTPAGQNTPAPVPTVGAVAGQDGTFTVTLTDAQDADGRTLYYQVQSCTDLAFDAAHGVTTFGGTDGAAQTKWVIGDPNQTKYFRWRSRTDGSNWTAWTYYRSDAACGPISVWSGLLRTFANALLNSQIYTTDGTNPLTQDGTTTRILVAAKDYNSGGSGNLHYNSGSVDPGTYGTFYVYAIDPKKSGGAVTYLTTQNPGDLTAADGLVCFGNITTAGGGGGTGGGGGSCPVTGSMVTMYDGTEKPVESLRAGDVLMGIDGGPEVVQRDVYPVPGQPCFSAEFSNGIKTRGVSSPHRYKYERSGWTQMFDAILGDSMMTRLSGVVAAATMTTKTFLGLQTVYPIELDRTRTFWADGVASHNFKQAIVI